MSLINRLPFPQGRAFTLLELLLVLAVIGILMGAVVAGFGAARESVLRSQARLSLAQWAAALERYLEDYGALPFTGAMGQVDGYVILDREAHGTRFLAALDPSFHGLPGADGVNPRRRLYHRFSTAELTTAKDTPAPVDPFGNSEIAVAWDGDGDGWISFDALPEVRAAGGDRAFAPPNVSETGLRARIAVYTAGAGRRASDVVGSWGQTGMTKSE